MNNSTFEKRNLDEDSLLCRVLDEYVWWAPNRMRFPIIALQLDYGGAVITDAADIIRIMSKLTLPLDGSYEGVYFWTEKYAFTVASNENLGDIVQSCPRGVTGEEGISIDNMELFMGYDLTGKYPVSVHSEWQMVKDDIVAMESRREEEDGEDYVEGEYVIYYRRSNSMLWVEYDNLEGMKKGSEV
jgi:hypothetical protein